MKQFTVMLMAASLLGPAAAQEADDNSLRLEEVFVTAQKRVQDVRDVPMSISVMTANDMMENGIKGFNDMMRMVPGVSFYDASSTVYLRGIGTPEQNPISEQSIAYIMDGVYIPKYSYLKPSFMDIERIEVLKGPQGTLFGRNATAGVINITNARPAEDWLAIASATGGNRDIEDVEAVISGPVTDKFGFRLAARKRTESGSTYSTTDNVELGPRDQKQARLTLAYEPTENIRAQLGVTRFKFFVGGGTEFHEYPEDLRASMQEADPNLESVLDRKTSLENHADDPDQRVDGGDGWLVPLTVSWDLWNHTFSSVTGYAELFEDLGIDLDKTAVDVVSSSVIQDETQISQEFRVDSPDFELPFGAGSARYIAGLYYFKHHNFAEIKVPLYSDSSTFFTAIAVGGAPFDPFSLLEAAGPDSPRKLDELIGTFDMDTRSSGIFGQLTWSVTEEVSILLGARQSRDVKTIDFDAITTGPVDFWSNATDAPFFVDKTNVFKDFSPKISVTWDMNEEVTAYFTYAEGFRAGSFNAGATTRANLEYDPESSVTLEAGLKTVLFDQRVRLNVGVFDTTYDDYQVNTFAGLGVIIQNVKEVRSKGVEADITAILLPGLMLRSSVGYMDARFVDHKDSACPTGPISDEDPERIFSGEFYQPERGCDLSGRSLHRAPRWTASLGLNYIIDVGWPVDFFVGWDAAFKDAEYQDSDLDPLDRQSAHWLFNGRVGMRAKDDSWRFEVHGKNLSDELVKTFSQDVTFQFGAHDTATNHPRYYFATLHYRYGS